MMMKLAQLFSSITDASLEIPGNAENPAELPDLVDAEVSSVTADSRKVKPGTVFVALEGGKNDGHQFLLEAAKAGAAALVIRDARREHLSIPAGVALIVSADPRKTLAEVSATLNNFPGKQMRMIGVTGTNGKTTVTHLIDRMLSDHGVETGLIGTLGRKTSGHKAYDDTGHTTPMAPELQSMLAEMRDEGVESVVMEVSSHALEQYRVHGCDFKVAVLTNLTQDHLDYHKTMEQYRDAKALLFSRLIVPDEDSSEATPTAVINLDSDEAQAFIDACPKGTQVCTYSIKNPKADIRIENPEYSTAGSTFTVITPQGKADVSLRLGGQFSVYNALAALAAGLALGISLSDAVASLERVLSIPGRFEAVSEKPYVIVDYAHTPDGLDNVLRAARAILPDAGQLITVFGCGGDRDATKRPKMGRIVEQLSDQLVITSDNPRSEDPQQIITDIISGLERFDSSRMVVEANRLNAIHLAIDLAKPADIVLIAGKGHEDYQILADRTIHFDDRETVRDYMKQKGQPTTV